MALLAYSWVLCTLYTMPATNARSPLNVSRGLSPRKGFSLVEIIIAVLLISILSAVAVPRLLTFRDSAGNSAAQQQLMTVALAARSLFDSADSFVGVADKLVEPTTGADRLPEIYVVGAAEDTAPTAGVKSKKVSVGVSGTGADAIFIAASPGGNTLCWFIKLTARTADQFAVTAIPSGTRCNTAAAPVPSSTDWKPNDFPAAP